MSNQKITPFLWFDNQAIEAARFYTSLFKDSRILDEALYTDEGKEITGKDAGTVMTVNFEIEGQRFIALNGGPIFTFNESISFVINCKDQNEVDYYWEGLLKDGGEESQCGWLKDKFGVSWQIVPEAFSELLSSADEEGRERLMKAMFEMKKFDIAKLQAAFDGK